jgi:hypothetical protein
MKLSDTDEFHILYRDTMKEDNIIGWMSNKIERDRGSCKGVGSGFDIMILQILCGQELIDNTEANRQGCMIDIDTNLIESHLSRISFSSLIMMN